MLILFILIYILVTLFIGLFSARYLKSTSDFIVAGHRLPLSMATATVFATWFGSETLLGASSQYAEYGLIGVIEDPFGASLCLLLIGLFYARPLYRMKLLTFGDFYKVTFGPKAEIVAALFLIISYFGWIAAQMVAMGIVVSLLSGWDLHVCIIATSAIVILYTYVGGMLAVSVTDFIQMIFIIIGLVIVLLFLLPEVGGISKLFSEIPKSHYSISLTTPRDYISFFAALITLGLGSIPQQDVYQRVMASKSEKVAVVSSIIGSVLYFTIALIPLVLALIAKKMNLDFGDDIQNMLPTLVLTKTPLLIQILFFGALISAIMSTASGAILAPAVILSENILKPHFFKRKLSDKKLLRITRISVLVVSAIALIMALVRRDIYELVGEASAISLVSLFVPLTAGLFFKLKSERVALCSMLGGFATWVICTLLFPDSYPIVVGLLASVLFSCFPAKKSK
ncbi:MAG: sodium:solute symporter family protein [Bacteroidetes bacterium]|nr:sodium:solute symporter family protein [Bacteroidota bacterium]